LVDERDGDVHLVTMTETEMRVRIGSTDF